MKAIILSAGLSTRFFSEDHRISHVKGRHKSLIMHNHYMSILEMQIAWLRKCKVGEIVIVCAEETLEGFQKYLQDLKPANVRLVVNEDASQFGSYKSIACGVNAVNTTNEDVWIIEGDVIPNHDPIYPQDSCVLAGQNLDDFGVGIVGSSVVHHYFYDTTHEKYLSDVEEINWLSKQTWYLTAHDFCGLKYAMNVRGVTPFKHINWEFFDPMIREPRKLKIHRVLENSFLNINTYQQYLEYCEDYL